MPKVDKQCRLLIPRDLINLIKLDQGTIGVFFDREENAIFITHLIEETDNYCISVRVLDEKNRIVVNKRILDLIGANKNSELVISARRGRIYIFKSDRD